MSSDTLKEQVKVIQDGKRQKVAFMDFTQTERIKRFLFDGMKVPERETRAVMDRMHDAMQRLRFDAAKTVYWVNQKCVVLTLKSEE